MITFLLLKNNNYLGNVYNGKQKVLKIKTPTRSKYTRLNITVTSIKMIRMREKIEISMQMLSFEVMYR